MSILENSFIETNQQYHRGFAIDEYNGTLSIVSCQRGNDGKLYADWGKLKKNKTDYMEKDMPWKVTLGNQEEAKVRLFALLRVLGVEAPEEESIPF